jgi:hypothetical protein
MLGNKKLIKMLEDYTSAFPEEIAFRERMLAFVKQYQNCFERSLEVGHITASVWLLSKDQSKALLMHHMKLNKWFQFGYISGCYQRSSRRIRD